LANISISLCPGRGYAALERGEDTRRTENLAQVPPAFLDELHDLDPHVGEALAERGDPAARDRRYGGREELVDDAEPAAVDDLLDKSASRALVGTLAPSRKE
jgi:hypothetical protein